MDEQKELEQKKEKIKNWLSNKYNLSFLGIFLFAIAIRIYYFTITKTQPLWWDEADYMAYAKNLAGLPVDWIITPQHNSIFPFIVSWFFRLGISEPTIKFVLEVIPSIFLILLTYYLCTQMYNDKRIALISSFIIAVFWPILFNTFRFHLGIPGLFLGFLAIFIFWQGYENKQKIFNKINPQWAVPIAAALSILAYATRRGYFLFGAIFLVYMLISKDFKSLIKDKCNWIALGISGILLLLFETFLFTNPITSVAGTYRRAAEFTFLPFDVFEAYFLTGNYFSSPLFILFYLGLLIMAGTLIMSFGHIKKSQKLKADLFSVISIILVLSYFLFYQMRIDSFGEPRWYFPLLFGAFICISKSTLFIADFFKKHHKTLPIIAIVLLMGIGGYYQVQHADTIIKSKAPSFEGIRQAGLYLKENSNPNDIIISIPLPQPAYYSERKVINLAMLTGEEESEDVSFEEFLSKLEQNPEARFILVSFSEPNHPEWMKKVEYAQTSSGQITFASWEIPFTNSKVDFTSGQQNLPQQINYENIGFKLHGLFQDVFVYEIIRNPAQEQNTTLSNNNLS